MRESPSIVPDALNRDVYLVLDNFGGALGGLAWPESDVAHTDRAIGAPLREPRAHHGNKDRRCRSSEDHKSTQPRGEACTSIFLFQLMGRSWPSVR